MALDDDVRREIQKRFEEVAKRANRLKEWMAFFELLRKLDGSFGMFLRTVRNVVGPPPNFNNDTMTNLSELWRNFQDTDLIDLNSFRDDVRFISDPLTPDVAGLPPGARLDVTRVTELCTLIRQDLNAQAIGPLGQHCEDLQGALHQQLASQRRAVQREVQELCDLTIELRAQFRPGNGPPAPGLQPSVNPGN
jgi:hypothetical protein